MKMRHSLVEIAAADPRSQVVWAGRSKQPLEAGKWGTLFIFLYSGVPRSPPFHATQSSRPLDRHADGGHGNPEPWGHIDQRQSQFLYSQKTQQAARSYALRLLARAGDGMDGNIRQGGYPLQQPLESITFGSQGVLAAKPLPRSR